MLSSRSIYSVGNKSLEGVWVPHGAWGGRAELHKLDSSGRVLQFLIWSYDKNESKWELCLHEGHGMTVAVFQCRGDGDGDAALPPTDPSVWESYSYPADLPGRLKEPRPEVHVMTLRELLALPLSVAVDYNLPWVVYRALYPQQQHQSGDGHVMAAATAQSLLDRCAKQGGLPARARIAATLASCIPTDMRGLSSLLSSIVVHEWSHSSAASANTGDQAAQAYFNYPDGPTATLAFLLEHPEITFTTQQIAHATTLVQQTLEEGLGRTYIEPIAGAPAPYSTLEHVGPLKRWLKLHVDLPLEIASVNAGTSPPPWFNGVIVEPADALLTSRLQLHVECAATNAHPYAMVANESLRPNGAAYEGAALVLAKQAGHVRVLTMASQCYESVKANFPSRPNQHFDDGENGIGIDTVFNLKFQAMQAKQDYLRFLAEVTEKTKLEITMPASKGAFRIVEKRFLRKGSCKSICDVLRCLAEAKPVTLELDGGKTETFEETEIMVRGSFSNNALCSRMRLDYTHVDLKQCSSMRSDNLPR
jgi:hypothetical protein